MSNAFEITGLNMLKYDSGAIKVFGLDHRTQEEDIKENIGVVFDQAPSQ